MILKKCALILKKCAVNLLGHRNSNFYIKAEASYCSHYGNKRNGSYTKIPVFLVSQRERLEFPLKEVFIEKMYKDQKLVTSGEFELQTCCMQNSYLFHRAIGLNSQFYSRNSWSKFRYLNFELSFKNTSRVLYFKTAWKRSFPRRLNVKYTWCVGKANYT